MYKTTYAIDVIRSNGSDTHFSDADPTPGAASAALAQIKACRDIDSLKADDEGVFHVIIPYHAIDFVVVTTTRTETEDPADDTLKNCTEDSGDDGGDDGGAETT